MADHLFSGTLRKMQTEAAAPVRYFLVFENDFICLNPLIGKKISLTFLGYDCLNCHSSEPIYRMGHCRKCFYESPSTADWILRPELSKAHLDEEERDLLYEKKIQLQPHVVYLSYTGEVKVGVTRQSQIPTRWIDQGASAAIKVLEVPNRYLAGVAEVALKRHLSDRTLWRQMLKPLRAIPNLVEEKHKIKPLVPNELAAYFSSDDTVFTWEYPVIKFPDKPHALKPDEAAPFTKTLEGVKGQYLIFEDAVCNIRSHEGFVVGIDF